MSPGPVLFDITRPCGHSCSITCFELGRINENKMVRRTTLWVWMQFACLYRLFIFLGMWQSVEHPGQVLTMKLDREPKSENGKKQKQARLHAQQIECIFTFLRIQWLTKTMNPWYQTQDNLSIDELDRDCKACHSGAPSTRLYSSRQCGLRRWFQTEPTLRKSVHHSKREKYQTKQKSRDR